MDLLRTIHDVVLPNLLPVKSPFPTPLAFFSLILFIWSLGPAIKGEVRFGFLVWLRLTWAAFLIPAVTGIFLALGGAKVPSSINASAEYIRENCPTTGDLTKYCQPTDPSQDKMHWMYVLFTLLSLYVIEVLIKGHLIDRRTGLRLLPVVTLFMYGCVYMIGHVATFPGSHPGN